MSVEVEIPFKGVCHFFVHQQACGKLQDARLHPVMRTCFTRFQRCLRTYSCMSNAVAQLGLMAWMHGTEAAGRTRDCCASRARLRLVLVAVPIKTMRMQTVTDQMTSVTPDQGEVLPHCIDWAQLGTTTGCALSLQSPMLP